ncbi:MAG: GntR family transcriptional regulator [Pirellulales bacterium]
MAVAAAGPPVISRASLADAVYDVLLSAILRGELAPGAELSAVALAERYQVSRTPITEALQRLTHDGLVLQEPHRQPRVVRLEREDVVEIYEMRGQLEAAAAERAATRMTPETFAELRQRLGKLSAKRRPANWAELAIEFDLQFHDAVAEAAGNRRLRDDIARYRRLVRCFCRLTGNDANLAAAVAEHRTILAALEARRPAAARKAMAAHIAKRQAAVLSELYAEVRGERQS